MLLKIAIPAVLGIIQIAEYTVVNASVKKFLTYAKIAALFTLIGFACGKANL